jgi:hypothetical protein
MTDVMPGAGTYGTAAGHRGDDSMGMTRGSEVMAWMAEPGRGTTRGAAPRLRGPGAGRPIRYFFSGIWLLYLIQPISALLGRRFKITRALCIRYDQKRARFVPIPSSYRMQSR